MPRPSYSLLPAALYLQFSIGHRQPQQPCPRHPPRHPHSRPFLPACFALSFANSLRFEPLLRSALRPAGGLAQKGAAVCTPTPTPCVQQSHALLYY